MGTISSGTGLISGLNISSIVDQLMKIESQPLTILQNSQTQVQTEQKAVDDLTATLQAVKIDALALRMSTALQASKATSSNTNLISASAAKGAIAGTWQFRVGRLVSAQQLVSTGFADTTTAKVAAGTITIQSAKARLTSDLKLETLNGQQGVRGGSIRITDRSGASAVVDLSTAVSVSDVLNAINSAGGISVQATTSGGRLVLSDMTGLGSGTLTVANVGLGRTATDLGLAGSSGTGTLTGADLVSVTAATRLSILNNGTGVETAGAGVDDLQIQLHDGTTFAVSLAGATTLGDVVNAINTASQASANPGALVASLDASGDGLRLTDSSAGGAALAVTALNGSGAAHDLGLLGSTTGAALSGHALLGGLQSALLDGLNGGSGVGRGTVSITDRAGNVSTLDLSAANTVEDVMNAINTAAAGGGAAANVTAALNATGTGLVLTDHSAGAGHLIVADTGGGTTATDLHLAVDDAVSQVSSGDLNLQFVGKTTQLSSLNAGRGIGSGTFRITNSQGSTATVTVSSSMTTVGDLITAINATGLGVTARVNDTGDGLVVEDTAGGGGQLGITDTSGTAATDLRIAGTAASGQTKLDGTSKVTITTDGTDTLAALMTRINDSGAALMATSLNDGSSTDPYRISLTARGTGSAGEMLVDSGTTGLGFSELVAGQDAVVSVGQATGGAQPLLITSTSNTLKSVIPNVTLTLTGADPGQTVTVTVADDPAGVVSSLGSLVTDFNSVMSKILQYTAYDTTTNKGQALMGDGTVIGAQQQLYSMAFAKYATGAQYQTLASIGFGLDSSNQLTLDQDKFTAAYAADAAAVQSLLTDATNGFLPKLQSLASSLSDTGQGTLSLESQRLQDQYAMYQDEITGMSARLDKRKTALTNQFYALETALAKLQARQSALTSLSQLVASFTGSSSSSTSSSSSSSG